MPTENETLLSVEGMTCHSCVSHVTRALRDLEGVADIDVRLAEGTVRVRHTAPVPHLVDALAEAGYPATPAR
ncbi:MAG: heavy-metal-associated domain-containing protein [Myxococcota bacterium]